MVRSRTESLIARPRERSSGLAALLLVFSVCLGATAVSAEVVNRVLLRVNDRIITLFDYELALAERRAQIARSAADQDEQRRLLEEAPLQVLRSLFDRLLIFSRADQLALTVSEIEVDDAVRVQLEQNGIENEDQLRDALMQSGLTMDQFRTQLRDRLLWERVTGRELLPRIQVSDEALRRVYEDQADAFVVPEKRRLQEIVVLDSGDLDSDERGQLAARLRGEWESGADPAELVQEVGEDKAVLIEIGWVSKAELNPDLVAVAFELAPGQISPVTSSRGGLHIVQNLESQQESRRPFEEVRDQLLRFERSRRFEQELDGYLAELEEKSYFRSDLPPELAGFRTKSGRAVREDALQIFTAPDSEEASELPADVPQDVPQPE